MFIIKPVFEDTDLQHQNLKPLLPGKRHLKVYAKLFERRFRYPVVFPEIRLCGKWLLQNGFKQGQTIVINHEPNKLIITIKEDEGNPPS